MTRTAKSAASVYVPVTSGPTAVDVLLRDARTIAFAAGDKGTWALYERLKTLLDLRCPDLEWHEREAVTRELARMAGV